jgi:sugar phosphate permease
MFDSAFLARKLTPRGRVLLLLAGAALLAGLGRDGIVAATQGVRGYLAMPNNELEIAYGAFGFGFYLSLVLGGALVELVGTALTFLICGIGVALATALTGCAWSLTVLTLSRLVFGLSVGAMLPAAAAALAPWTPPRERGWAMGTVQAALAAGGILAWPLFGLVHLPGAWFDALNGVLAQQGWRTWPVLGQVLLLGAWRGGFLILAGLAAAWVVLWRRGFSARPGDNGDPPPPVHWRGALPILVLPTVLALLQGWGVALCQEWVPRYLLETWHFDIKLSTWVWAASGAAMVLGCLVGGFAADRSLNHSSNIRSAHQVVPGIGFLLAAFSLILLPIGENQLAIAVSLGLALFGLQAAGTMLWVFAIDIGGRHTGVSAGCIGFGLLLSRLISPLYLFGLGRPLPAVVVVMTLVLAGVLSFRLRPHIELPVLQPPAPVATEPEDEAAAEIEALLDGSGKKKARA